MADIDFLDFSALISSKICHDIIGPVGAMFNGFEVLEDDEDNTMHDYAMEVIQNNAKVVRAQLELARMVYGAGGGADSEVAITQLQSLLGNTLSEKHSLHWETSLEALPKEPSKLLSLLTLLSVKALPRGGELTISVVQDNGLVIEILCTGKRAKFKEDSLAILKGSPSNGIDALNIQSYYAYCLLEKLKGTFFHEPLEEDTIKLGVSLPSSQSL